MAQATHITLGAARLAEAAKGLGLSGEALAAKLGCSQPHMSRILNGQRRPSYELAARIEDHFQIPARAWAEAQP